MKKTIKIFSVFLATIMFFSVFSAANPVFAAELQKAELTEEAQSQTVEEGVITDEEANEETSSEVEVLNEITELRDEYTKYFRQSDGSYIASRYSTPVHYRDGDNWVEYDFNLEEKQSIQRSVTSASVYEPVASDIPVKFPTELSKNANNEISIAVDDTTITFAPKAEQSGLKNSAGSISTDAELVSANITASAEVSTFSQTAEPETEEEIKTNALKVEDQKGAVKYENVFDKVSLEYELSSNVLKESIVLNEKQNKNVFEFTMDMGGLYPRKEADGSIVLYKDSNYTQTQSVIVAPYMLDSVGAYSDAVSMELTPDGDKYTLIVTADKNWLNDKARVYPVIIDPTIVLDMSRADTMDCYVDASKPNTRFPLDYYLYAGHSTLGKTRTFIKFDLPDLPDECCVIQNVALNIYQMSVDAGSEKRYISAHQVTESWNHTTTGAPTWNNQPAFNSVALDYAELTYGVGDFYNFDITRAAKAWFEGEQNNGIMLKGLDESKVGRAQIISAEFNISEVVYPTISVTYRNNKGLEGYWSYSSFSQASCGVGNVNDYSGNLVYQIPVASTVSEIMPVSLSLVHNTYASRDVYTSGKNGSYLTTPGRGWKLNIQETILPSTQYGLTGDSAEQYPYVYTDGDGTEHYIQKVTKKDDNDNEIITYEDEDGLGLTLDPEATNTYTYKLTDKQDNEWYFNAKGNLGYMKDANGNTINIYFKDTNGDGTREKDKIDYIKDGTGHTLSFTYYENTNYIKTITDNAGRVITFNTVNGRLNSIAYYDDTLTYIDYEDIKKSTGEIDPEIALINFVWSSDRVGVNFDYTTSQTGYRVKKVKEFAAAAVYPSVEDYIPGQVVTFDRTKYNTTVIRSGGIDGVTYDTSTDTTTSQTAAKRYDDIVTTLQFDNFGRTVSQQVSYGNGGEVGAGAYNYQNKEGSENKITDAASLGKNTRNMIKTGNAESFAYWAKNKTSGMSTAHYTSTGTPYVGHYTLAIANSYLSKTNAGNSNYGQAVTGFTEGKYYTFSAFVKTTNVAPIGAGGLEGAYLQISATGGTENKTGYSQVLTGTTDTAINNGWRRLTATVEVKPGTTNLTVYMCLRNANGYVYFDGTQVEEGTTPNAVNLLLNSSFEAESDGLPVGWAKRGSADYTVNSSNTVLTGVTSAAHKDGAKSLIISGSANEYKGFSQTIPVQGNPNDTYILSGWAAAYAVNSTYHSHYEIDGEEPTDDELREILESTDKEDDKTLELVEDSKFEIAVTVFYNKTDKNGNTQTEPVPQDKDPVKFNTTVADWQYASTPIVLKYEKEAGDECTYTPTSIEIMPRYNLQANYAYFDHIQLIKDVAQSYVYDKEGNLVSVSANAEQKNNMKYDGEDNLTEYYDAGYNKTTFEYQEGTHNLTKVTSPKGVKTEYMYNTMGQVLATETKNPAGNYSIKTSVNLSDAAEGISARAYIESNFDQNGYRTQYTYDPRTGTLLTTTSPNGLVTTNTYKDSKFSKLSRVSAQDTSVKYGYVDNRIKDITFGYQENVLYNEKYSFEYDEFGNVLNTKVGSVALSTNTYVANNGGLLESVYGNNDGVKYTYDYSGNVIAIKHKDNINGGTTATYGNSVYTWQYSSNGTPRVHQDGINQIRYDYSYDSIGRLIRTDMSNSVTSARVGSTEYGYNTRGHLTSVSNEIGGKAYTQIYSYSDTGVTGAKENAADGLPTRYIALGVNTDYSYDSLNRLTTRNVDLDNDIQTLYFYHGSKREGNYETTQISCENLNGTTFAYTYDEMGNISTIKKNGVLYREYTYDGLGQLTGEIQYDNKKVIEYQYNHLGNIKLKAEYQYSNSSLTGSYVLALDEYYYGDDGKDGWNYLLTGYDANRSGIVDENEKISYDSIGNPIVYRGAQMAWKGRQLTGYAKNGTMSTFTYDADGLRGSKTVGGVKTVYQYVGDKLYYEKRGDSQEFYYFYDSYGNLASIYYTFSTDDYTSSANYYVTTNIQGDVTALYNSTGALVARYEYDAWGNVLSVTDANGNAITQWYHIANANPIRYRGYYYDSDLSLYYLQSRYYDSETGRFINADSILSQDSVLGYNMFAYCLNNPVTMADTTGELPFFLVTAAIGAVAGAIIGGVVAAKNGGNVWAGIGIGAAAGGLAGAGLGAAAAGAMLAGSATASTAAVMMGAATLNATVATGGLGAGVAYIANNILGNPTYTDPVLYSGGDSALKAAQNYSATSGGTVIGDTIIGKTADCLSSRIPWLDNFIWKGASELFCHQATGSAHAFVCNSMFNASTSIFWNYEMPVLQSKAGYISEIIIEVFEGSI